MRQPIRFPSPDDSTGDGLVDADERHPEPAARDRIAAIVRDQPGDSTFDDVMRELAFERLVRRGLDDLANGRLLETADVLRVFRTWPR